MDKYEYRVKTEQMLEHYEKKQFRKAMEIADTIDWRRVKSPAMLNTVSEIYENNGEFQKSRDTLMIAFDRAPSSRKVVYRLAVLALKLNDLNEASDCYGGICKTGTERSESIHFEISDFEGTRIRSVRTDFGTGRI